MALTTRTITGTTAHEKLLDVWANYSPEQRQEIVRRLTVGVGKAVAEMQAAENFECFKNSLVKYGICVLTLHKLGADYETDILPTVKGLLNNSESKVEN